MGFNANVRPHKYKKARYSFINVINKDLLNIIREFENLPYKSYENKRPKHEPTNSYFYLSIQLAKCMMRDDALSSQVYPVRTEITALSSHVCSTDEDESKGIKVHKTLLQSCSTDESELCSTEEDKPECTFKKKNANIEVTYDVPSYFNAFNVFKCGRHILYRIDV